MPACLSPFFLCLDDGPQEGYGFPSGPRTFRQFGTLYRLYRFIYMGACVGEHGRPVVRLKTTPKSRLMNKNKNKTQ